jgi:hypothetical protein
MVLAVFVDNVVDHFAPTFHAEVHVDIGERYALGI